METMLYRDMIESLFQLYFQIKMSEYSLYKLYLCKDSYIECLYYIQNLLVSLGNISKLLENYKNETSIKRSKNLIDLLKIDLSYIPNILSKELRNINEHIDEYLDFFGDGYNPTASDFSISDGRAFGSYSLRNYNTKMHTIIFTKKGKVYTMKLSEIKKELRYLRKSNEIEYLFDRYRGCDTFRN